MEKKESFKVTSDNFKLKSRLGPASQRNRSNEWFDRTSFSSTTLGFTLHQGHKPNFDHNSRRFQKIGTIEEVHSELTKSMGLF